MRFFFLRLTSLLATLQKTLAWTRITVALNRGIKPKASHFKQWAVSQGWELTQTPKGPLKYIDENGVIRVTLKQGSSRTPGSSQPHVELRDANGIRVDPSGNPVSRKSSANHTPIDWDI